MPVRTLIELAHLAVGLLATALIAGTAAWAYPLGRETIEWVGLGSAVVVVAMAINPVRRALAIDRGRAARDAR